MLILHKLSVARIELLLVVKSIFLRDNYSLHFLLLTSTRPPAASHLASSMNAHNAQPSEY